ncbi:lysophospholipid acyltransferase family protein [Chloroflexota bacterium]
MTTMKVLLVILCRWRVYGQDNLPKEGPILIVSNHMNFVDPPLLAASLHRKLTFMAKKELFQSWMSRPIVQAFSFPISRGVPNKESLRQAASTLQKGKPLVMFPEGKRSPNAQMIEGFPGSSLIALKAGVPTLPIGITGSEKLKNFFHVFRHNHITVNVGVPFDLPEADRVPTRKQLVETTDMIMHRIAELLPEEYQGVYRKNGNSQQEGVLVGDKACL